MRDLEEHTGEKITHIACGQFHTCFLSNLWRVFACGLNEHGQLGIDTKDL